MANHEVLKLDLHLKLGHTGLDELDDMTERIVGDFLSSFHARKLAHVLHGAKPIYQARGLN